MDDEKDETKYTGFQIFGIVLGVIAAIFLFVAFYFAIIFKEIKSKSRF